MVYPLDSASIEAFARATSLMREAVLAVVDARPQITPAPRAHSRAMADLAAQESLADAHGWGLEPVIDCFQFGGLQIVGAVENAASIAQLYGSDRSFIVTPYVALRVLAESAGRAKWLFNLEISTEARVIRTQNLKMEDYSARKRMFPSERREMGQRIQRIRATAQRRGHQLTRELGYWRLRYIGEPPPPSSELVRAGFGDSDYGRLLKDLTSGMVHGSAFAYLSHRSDIEPLDRGGLLHIGLGSSSRTANILLAAAGLALRDAVNAEYQYKGYESEEWSAAVGRLMRAGRELISQT